MGMGCQTPYSPPPLNYNILRQQNKLTRTNWIELDWYERKLGNGQVHYSHLKTLSLIPNGITCTYMIIKGKGSHYFCALALSLIHKLTLLCFVSRVAIIGGHVLYKIEDTLIYPIMQPGSKPYHPDESKLVRTHLLTHVHTYIHAYIQIHSHTYIHTRIHTNILTYIHIHAHTYIYTYIHMHI